MLNIFNLYGCIDTNIRGIIIEKGKTVAEFTFTNFFNKNILKKNVI